MRDSAASQKSENAMMLLPGVLSASVDLTTEIASVAFDPAIVKYSQITDAIAELGLTPENIGEKKARRFAELQRLNKKAALRQLVLAALLSLLLFYLSISNLFPLSLPLPSPLDPAHSPLVNTWLQFIFSAFLFLSARSVLIDGFSNLIKAIPNMNSLVAVSASAAFLFSAYSMLKIAMGDPSAADTVFYFASALILDAVLAANFFSSLAFDKAAASFDELLLNAPQYATVIRNDSHVTISISDLKVGDLVVVLPGERFPCDGSVESGASTADISQLTGQNRPVPISKGSRITGGAVNGEALIELRATGVGGDTALAQIIRLAESVYKKKRPHPRLPDKFASYFLSIVLLIAVISAFIWFFAGQTVDFVLRIFISVIIASCPAALAFVAPASLISALFRAKALGIIFKTPDAIEDIHDIKHIAFDKTGTLSNGSLSLSKIVSFSSIPEDKILLLAAAAESASLHPISLAVTNELKRRNLSPLSPDSLSLHPGKGVEARLNKNISVLVGNDRFMADFNIDISPARDAVSALIRNGNLISYCAVAGKLAAVLAAADSFREDSRYAVDILRRQGLLISILSGDNEFSVAKAASLANISLFSAPLPPGKKAEAVLDIRNSGTPVAMIGDGIKDTAALAAADIGIAFGSDTAFQFAHILLSKPSLRSVSDAIALSHATIRNIKFNLFWAFFFASALIPIAAGLLSIFGGPLLTPPILALSLFAGLLAVFLNALRLRRFLP